MAGFHVNKDDLCFRKLLARALASGTTAAEYARSETTYSATNSFFIRKFRTNIDGRQHKITSENSSLRKFAVESNCMPNITSEATSEVVPSQFEPITPEKTSAVDDRQQLGMTNLRINEMLSIKHVQETSIKMVELEEIHQNKVQSQLDVDRLRKNMSTQLENYKPDKGGTGEVDLIKTPQQKPRRKKHRPKVIIEGQSKITPKPRVKRPSDPQETTGGKRRNVPIKGVSNPTAATPLEREINETDTIAKPSSAKGTMNGKRKYVRREEVHTPAVNTLDQDANETTDAKTVQQTRNSCRRSLKYDFEGQGRNENNFDMEPQAIAALDQTLYKQQNFGFLSNLGPTVRLEKRRSKETDPVSKLGSLLEMCKQVIGSLGHGATTSKAVDTGAKTTTKKRSKRKLNIISTLKEIHSHHKLVTRLMGSPLAKTWICRSPVDSFTEQCDRLDLNAVSCQDAAIEHNTFMAYHMNYQVQYALVPYQINGPLVPFDSSFYLGRRRRPRPKVDLDDETNRVWKLLLENINNEGIDGMGEENEKWWEEERRVFHGRADSFIACMHLVQGDRRFSPWKGSVLDSVIGAFLTQNVSDHLSSSAFMSLAARFPSDPESNGQLSGFSKNGPDVSLESVVNKSTGFFGDERDLDGILSSQNSMIYSHNSADSIIALTGERTESCSLSTFEAEPSAGSNTSTRMEHTILHGDNNRANEIKLSTMDRQIESVSVVLDTQNQNANKSDITYSKTALHLTPSSGAQEGYFDIPLNNGEANAKEVCEKELSGSFAESATQTALQKFLAISCEVPNFCSEKAHSSNHLMDMYQKIAENLIGKLESQFQFQENNYKMQEVSNIPIFPENSMDITGNSKIDNSRTFEKKEMGSNLKDPGKRVIEHKAKRVKFRKEKNSPVDWDSLRKQAQEGGRRRERTTNTMNSVDWDAVRCADINEISQTIKKRGMNNMLAERIKDFLNRLVRDHGSIDLEWLRDILPDKAKEFLLSVRGLGLKSVECVRLLTLHHRAFPVDTNVARIAVRLGWVPLQPLPTSLHLHLLELYPELDSIQKYLWPRLCKLDQRTLYELHYQMITFGKVFCTKSKPNCNACPMRGECRHFASAFASSRFALPAPEEKSIVSAVENHSSDQNAAKIINSLRLPLPQANQAEAHTEVSYSEPIIEVPATPELFVEVPATPESDQTQDPECDIEDDFEDPDDIPTIQLNMEELTHNLQEIIEKQMQLQEGDMSKALVALTPESSSIPMPKLKNVNRLRTEHQVEHDNAYVNS